MRESLIHFLLNGAETCARLEGDCLPAEWIPIAESWGALPRLRERAARLAVVPSKELLYEIEQRYLAGYVRSVLQARAAMDVLAAFERAGIRAVTFKGLASLGLLYRSPDRRVILDVDVLIGERDLEQAATVLAERGFQPEVAGSLADYVEFVKRAPGFGGNEVLAFHNERGCTIDLHWRLGRGFETQLILDRRQQATLLEASFPAVSNRDGILLCAHHSLRNHFSPDKIMRDLFDLELWCARIVESGETDDARRETFERGLAVPLLAQASILAAHNRNGAAAAIASVLHGAASAKQRKSAARLVALFTAQAREGTFERDVLYLFRTSELKQLLAGIVFGGRRHMEIARSMDSALAGEPMTVGRRIAALGRSLKRLRPRHVGMLRALARTKDEFAKLT